MKLEFYRHFLAPALSLTLLCAEITWSQTGSVFTDQKIGSGVGGFEGTLATLDTFGRSITPLGDLDGDGIGDAIVGAPRELDPASRMGKAWLLFLNEDGTVRDEREIAPSVPLGPTDQFGWSVASLGNLTGMGGVAGVIEVAVGASGAASGGSNRGAVWILSLDSSGTVVDEQLLVATGLANGDQFGSAVASLGDLDGDTIPDLAVGGRGSNDGGVDAGAVWVLFLDDDGTVQSQTKVSDLVGGFTAAGGNLDALDGFGSALAPLGDVNGDGRGDLVVGTPGDDDAGADAGALWVLYLNASGTVQLTHKIATVDSIDPAGDLFGSSVAALGDLDSSGGVDLAVGAPRDDDGLTDRGAAWIVFLDTDEQSLGAQKISDTQGGFAGTLNGGLFGAAVASLGDLDGDGRIELAVGESAAFAPPSGTGTGAVWVLSLIGPGDTVWNGETSSSWFDASNWSNGLPSPTRSAVIREAATEPMIGADAVLDAACMDLALGENASLSLANLTEPLAVHRSARILGDLSGVADLRLVGTGSLLATLPIDAPVVVAATGTIELRGTDLALHEGLDLVGGALEVDAGCTATVVGTATFSGGTLNGSGALDLRSLATFSGTSVSSPPTLMFGGDLEADSSFAPASGTVYFDGTAPQTITRIGSGTTVSFHGVAVLPGAEVTTGDELGLGAHLRIEREGADFGRLTSLAELVIAGEIVLDGELVVAALEAGSLGEEEGGGTLDLSGGSGCAAIIHGDVNFTGSLAGACSIVISPASEALVNAPGGFPGHLVIDTLGIVRLVSTTLTVQGNLTVLNGTFEIGTDATITVNGPLGVVVEAGTLAPGVLDIGAHAVTIEAGAASTPVTVFGEVRIGPGGRLRLDDNDVAIESGGRLTVDGAPGDLARIGGAPIGGYTLTVEDGADLVAQHFLFERMGPAGIRILDSSGTGVLDMHDGSFDRVANGGVLLEISRSVPTALESIVFLDSDRACVPGEPACLPPNTYNVRVPAGSAEISFTNWSGEFGGPALDDPALEAVWGAKVVFFLVKESQAKNEIRWRLRPSPDVIEFLLDRADLPSGPFAPPLTTSSSSFSFTDTTVTPGQGYRYRLRERLAVGMTTVLNVLGERTTDGVPTPGSRPAPEPEAPLPFLAAGPGSAGRIEEALRSASPGEWVEFRLGAGTHAAFEVPRRFRGNLRLVGDRRSPAELDASRGPLAIRGLDAHQSVELSNLVIDAGADDRLALLIERSDAAVLLDQLEIRGAAVVQASRAVSSQRGLLGGLTLEDSRLGLLDGVLRELELSGASRLESWGIDPAGVAARIESRSHWSAHREPLPWLEVAAEGSDLRALLQAPPGTLWWLSGSTQLGDLLRPGGRSVLLGQPRMVAGDGPDAVRLELPPELAGSPIYLRADALDPLRRSRCSSNVESTRP